MNRNKENNSIINNMFEFAVVAAFSRPHLSWWKLEDQKMQLRLFFTLACVDG